MKEDVFSWRENQGMNVNVERWKDKYLYINMHEIFFVEFPHLLYEWLKRKNSTNIALRPLESVVWDQATIDRLKELDNKWDQSIVFWFS
jgi:hypothetical protein